jgi:hypothetical protein
MKTPPLPARSPSAGARQVGADFKSVPHTRPERNLLGGETSPASRLSSGPCYVKLSSLLVDA